jgi:hypothetical protein
VIHAVREDSGSKGKLGIQFYYAALFLEAKKHNEFNEVTGCSRGRQKIKHKHNTEF